jgi:hypothetical protein
LNYKLKKNSKKESNKNCKVSIGLQKLKNLQKYYVLKQHLYENYE